MGTNQRGPFATMTSIQTNRIAVSQFLHKGRWLVFPLVVAFWMLLPGTPINAQETVHGEALNWTGIEDPSLDADELALSLLPLSEQEVAAAASIGFELVRDKTAEIVDARIAVREADEEAASKLQGQILELGDKRQLLAEKYLLVLDAWEAKGGDPDSIAIYRKNQRAIAVGELKAADQATLLNHFLDWLGSRDGGIAILVKLAIAAASFMELLVVAGIVRRVRELHLPALGEHSGLLGRVLGSYASGQRTLRRRRAIDSVSAAGCPSARPASRRWHWLGEMNTGASMLNRYVVRGRLRAAFGTDFEQCPGSHLAARSSLPISGTCRGTGSLPSHQAIPA